MELTTQKNRPHPSQMQFYELAVGARFEFEGHIYQKSAMDFAQEEDGSGRMIRREWEVSPVGELLLLSKTEAEKWKPRDWQTWSEHLKPAPGQD